MFCKMKLLRFVKHSRKLGCHVQFFSCLVNNNVQKAYEIRYMQCPHNVRIFQLLYCNCTLILELQQWINPTNSFSMSAWVIEIPAKTFDDSFFAISPSFHSFLRALSLSFKPRTETKGLGVKTEDPI